MQRVAASARLSTAIRRSSVNSRLLVPGRGILAAPRAPGLPARRHRPREDAAEEEEAQEEGADEAGADAELDEAERRDGLAREHVGGRDERRRHQDVALEPEAEERAERDPAEDRHGLLGALAEQHPEREHPAQEPDGERELHVGLGETLP